MTDFFSASLAKSHLKKRNTPKAYASKLKSGSYFLYFIGVFMFNTLPTRQMYGEKNFNDFLTHLQKSIFIKSIEEIEFYLYIHFFNGDSEIIQSSPWSTVNDMELEYNAIMKKAAEKLSIV